MRRGILATASLLAGGSLFAACEARVHDSIVGGTESWFLGLFDPANLEELGILDLDGETDTTTP